MNAEFKYLSHKHNLYALLILGFVYVLMMWLIPSAPISPKGIAYAWEAAGSSIPADEVQLITSESFNAQGIGNLSAELAITERITPELLAEKETVIINYAKELAGSIGGNGLLVSRIATSQNRVMVLEGIAVTF